MGTDMFIKPVRPGDISPQVRTYYGCSPAESSKLPSRLNMTCLLHVARSPSNAARQSCSWLNASNHDAVIPEGSWSVLREWFVFRELPIAKLKAASLHVANRKLSHSGFSVDTSFSV